MLRGSGGRGGGFQLTDAAALINFPLQIALTLRARAILLAFERFALKITRLPIQA